MKYIYLLVFAFYSTGALAADLGPKIAHFQDLFEHPSSATQISKSSYNRGDTRPKAILKGVFYIGGTDKKRSLLSGSFLQKICKDDFSRVYSVYKKVNRDVSCGSNAYNYTYIGEATIANSGGDRVYKLLSYLYNEVINGDAGAVYLHCHYGVHASNVIAQMAQMQFCGISREQAKKNWDTIDLYDSLGAKGRRKQFKKIDGFKPYPEFQISSQQRAQICY